MGAQPPGREIRGAAGQESSYRGSLDPPSRSGRNARNLTMTMTFDASESRGAVRYLEAFRVHWLLILALTVLAVGAAEIVTLTATKRYQTSADIQIQALPAFGGDPFQGFELLDRKSTRLN